jgi:hypothetical protein
LLDELDEPRAEFSGAGTATALELDSPFSKVLTAPKAGSTDESGVLAWVGAAIPSAAEAVRAARIKGENCIWIK